MVVLARRWASPIGLVLISAVMVIMHVRSYTQFSPVDELQHVDYAEKVSRGELVRHGDSVSEQTLRDESCLGLDYVDTVLPPCDSKVLPLGAFQNSGANTAYIHPPVYYAATGVVARALQAVLGLDRFTVAARLVGVLWLAAGMIGVWLLSGELGVRGRARFAVSAFPAFVPVVLFSSATVTPDAALLACGSFLALITLRVERGRLATWTLGVAAAVLMAIKGNNIVAIGIALAYLLLRSRADMTPEPSAGSRLRMTARASIVLVVGTSIVAGGWFVAYRSLERVRNDPMTETLRVGSITSDQVLGALPDAVPPSRNAYEPLLSSNASGRTWTWLVDLLLVAGPVGAALVVASDRRSRPPIAMVDEAAVDEAAVDGPVSRSPDPRAGPLAVATLCGFLTTGPLFVLVNYVAAGVFVEIPARYGLAAAGPACAVLGVALSPPTPRRAFAVALVTGAAVVVFSVVI